jgi:hypothetical protein
VILIPEAFHAHGKFFAAVPMASSSRCEITSNSDMVRRRILVVSMNC